MRAPGRLSFAAETRQGLLAVADLHTVIKKFINILMIEIIVSELDVQNWIVWMKPGHFDSREAVCFA